MLEEKKGRNDCFSFLHASRRKAVQAKMCHCGVHFPSESASKGNTARAVCTIAVGNMSTFTCWLGRTGSCAGRL